MDTKHLTIKFAKNNKTLISLFASLIFLFSINTTFAIESMPYIQDNGSQFLVSIEAENYHTIHAADAGQIWTETTTAKSGFTGTAAMQATPAGSEGFYSAGYSSLSTQLDYQIKFVTAGTHYLWIRGSGLSSASDSLHAGLNGAELASAEKISSFKPYWGWSNRQQGSNAVVSINVPNPGVHSLNLWMREPGMIVDKVVLTTDPNFIPNGSGPINSLTLGKPVVSVPVISPAGGVFVDSTKIKLTVTPPEATIYYTTDGSNPSVNSALYSGIFDLTESAILKAIAYLDGYAVSDVAIEDFVITVAGVNQAPELNSIGNKSVYEDQSLQFIISATDLEKTTPILSADLSDLPAGASFDANTGEFRWDTIIGDAGIYTAVFTATDGDDLTLETNETITIIVNEKMEVAPYLQDSGSQKLVSIESENFHAIRESDAGQIWSATTANSGFSGSAAMQATPNGTAGYYSSGYSSKSTQLDYNIEFVTAGTHYLWIRGKAFTSASDSLHAGLDGVEQASAEKISFFKKTWGWSNKQQSTRAVVVLNVSNPGMHTLNLWMRESGMIVDKLVLTTDPTYVPKGKGPITSFATGASVVSSPAINPVGGSFQNSVSITMTADPSEASIYYTTDGSEPNISSSLYTGEFDLTTSATLKAAAFLAGYQDSNVSSANFTITTVGGNQSPVLTAIGDKAVYENQSLNFTVEASDADLTTPILNADMSDLPVGANFNSVTGEFNWPTISGDAGTYAVTFTATDSVDPTLSVSESITIWVNAALNTTPYLQDSSGQFIVSIEAEDYHGVRDSSAGQMWTTTTATGGYTGTAAMQASPTGTAGYYSAGYSTESTQLDYNIEFVTAGTHYLWIRGNGPTTGSDSLHAGLNGTEVSSAETISYFNQFWDWSNTQQGTNAVVTLNIPNPGVHTLNLWMRESGMVVDKIVLTTDPSFVPNGSGPTVSLLSGAPVVDMPTINPTGGSFVESVQVSLDVTPSDSTVYYTLDGSEPTTASLQYSSAFTLTESTTVKAIGIRGGYNNSVVNTVNFVKINAGNASSFFEHYWEMNEPVAGTYFDSVGGNSATCVNCPESSNGIINGAQSFDGVDNEVNVTADSSYNWDNEDRFTVELWLNTSSCNGADAAIGRNDIASSMKWWVGCQNGHAAFQLTDHAGNGDSLVSSINIDDGNWHHIVAVRDGFTNTNKLYVDGELTATANVIYDTNGFYSAANVNIGWMSDASIDYHFNGEIDEVAIAGRVLTDSEIVRHFNDGHVGLAKGYLGDSGALKLMPIGDSITNRVGYRPELYFDLTAFGHNVNFVGSGTDPNGTHDRNHEGHSGYTAADIASSLGSWLNQNSPDLITLHIGTNGLDLLGLEDILNIIDAHDSTIPVVLARIINRSVHHQDTTDYNVALQAMADARISNGDKILIVDHEPALNYSTDMLDDKHPNSSGYTKMKDVWMSGMRKLLTSNVDVAPTLITEPDALTLNSGEQYSYSAQAEGYPLVSYSLQSAPSGMEIHPDTGELTWVSAVPGNYNVVVEASNENGFDSQEFTITVQ